MGFWDLNSSSDTLQAVGRSSICGIATFVYDTSCTIVLVTAMYILASQDRHNAAHLDSCPMSGFHPNIKKDFRPAWIYVGTRLISFTVIPGKARLFSKKFHGSKL